MKNTRLLVCAALLSGALSVSNAQNTFQDLDGDWHTPVNWTLGVPVVGQEVIIGDNPNNNTATVSSAGAVSGASYVGFGSGNSGTVVVESGQVWETGLFRVGFSQGAGTVLIQGGGSIVTSSTGRLGSNLGSSGLVTVTGTGSSWTVGTNQLRVGSTAQGTLIVDNGGLVSASNIVIGSQGSSAGTATVGGGSGTSSLIATGNMNIGNLGSGSVEILSGGLVQASTMSGGNSVGSLIEFSGGELRLVGGPTSSAGNYLTFNSGGGTIDIANSAMIHTFSGDGDGDGGFTKEGAGTLVMTGTTTHGGATLVSEGKLMVNGSFTASDVTVASGAILGGIGFIGGDVFVQAGGARAPGLSPGTMSGVNEFWAGGGIYNWEINAPETTIGTAGNDPGWDLISLDGVLDIAATSANQFIINLLTLDPLNNPGLLDGFFAVPGQQWTIVSTLGGITGFDPDAFLLNTAGFLNPIGDALFTIGLTNNGNDLTIFYSGIPEPSRAMLMAVALGALLVRRRR